MKIAHLITQTFFISMILIGSASASSRDEVFALAFACGVIGDDAAWLDCYYGAAQDMRSALGLPPARPYQIKLAARPPEGQVSEATSIFRNGIMSKASNCRLSPNDHDWLACFYAAASPMRVKLGLQQATSSGSQADSDIRDPLTNAAKGAVQSFGAQDSISKIESRMLSFTFDDHGIFTVSLANGQVWRQISGDTRLAHWTGKPSQYLVVISHGLFGSFNLEVRNSPGLFKVRRIV